MTMSCMEDPPFWAVASPVFRPGTAFWVDSKRLSATGPFPFLLRETGFVHFAPLRGLTRNPFGFRPSGVGSCPTGGRAGARACPFRPLAKRLFFVPSVKGPLRRDPHPFGARPAGCAPLRLPVAPLTLNVYIYLYILIFDFKAARATSRPAWLSRWGQG